MKNPAASRAQRPFARVGRWSLLPEVEPDPIASAKRRAGCAAATSLSTWAGGHRSGQPLRRLGAVARGPHRRRCRPPAGSQGRCPGRRGDGGLVLYLERGGRTALTYTADQDLLGAAAAALAALVRSGRLSGLTVAKVDGTPSLAGDHPLATALVAAGFHTAPQGLRLRR